MKKKMMKKISRYSVTYSGYISDCCRVAVITKTYEIKNLGSLVFLGALNQSRTGY